VELWQIENSPPAPKFNVICRPNEWKRSIRTGGQDGDLTDTKTKQLEFWQQLKEYVAAHRPELKLRTPRPQHWFNVAIGRSDCHVSWVADSREDKVRCALYIPNSKELYQTFLAHKAEIENELGVTEPIAWQELPNKKASRIRVDHDFDFSDESTWADAFAWLADMAVRFRRVFAKNWE